MENNNAELNELLEHSGIKGMKWGIRRYQYKDGSLTPAGKKRYNKDVEKLKKENEKLDNEIKGRKAQARANARVEKLIAENEAKKLALKDGKLTSKAAKAAKKAAEKLKADESAEAKKKQKDTEIEESLTRKDIDFQKKKAKILRSGNPSEILKNGHLFDDQEIAAAKQRLDNEAQIRALMPEKTSKKIFMALYKDIVVPTTNNVAQDFLKNLLKNELLTKDDGKNGKDGKDGNNGNGGKNANTTKNTNTNTTNTTNNTANNNNAGGKGNSSGSGGGKGGSGKGSSGSGSGGNNTNTNTTTKTNSSSTTKSSKSGKSGSGKSNSSTIFLDTPFFKLKKQINKTK